MIIKTKVISLHIIRQKHFEIKLREENLAKVKEIEGQKNAQILNGLSDLAINVLLKGASLKEVWSNLWKDLAREGIQRLFGVSAEPSLLGMLFGIKKAHSGEDIGVSAPRMHSGGNVMAGRRSKTTKYCALCRSVRKSTASVTAAATKFWQLLPCGRWIIQPKRRHRSLLRRSIPAALPNT